MRLCLSVLPLRLVSFPQPRFLIRHQLVLNRHALLLSTQSSRFAFDLQVLPSVRVINLMFHQQHRSLHFYEYRLDHLKPQHLALYLLFIVVKLNT